ncbi:MAG TPA: rod shape-determining protein RodA [Bacteroidaceae bacterium]|nr:rod shape-determining protein RodA [Bacteroidaceae bacterium]
MVTRNVNVWKQLDWIVVGLYILLLICGWFSICGASYEVGQLNFFEFASRPGKQMMWIGLSLVLGFMLLMIEDKFYELFSYPIYIAMLGLLFVTIFIAPDVKGSHSWLKLGPVSLQPAEFAKFATALTLARFMGSYGYSINKLKYTIRTAAIVFIPLLLIIAQKETGSALVYLAFFLVFYREGMPGSILFVGVSAVIYFVVGIRFGDSLFCHDTSNVGHYAVLIIITAFTLGLLFVYKLNRAHVFRWLVVLCLVPIISYQVAIHLFPFDQVLTILGLCVSLFIYLVYQWIVRHKLTYGFIALFTIGSIGFLYSSNYVFNNVLGAHQSTRIKVLLGIIQDTKDAGYNVAQSKIAIGSGGLTGKGFLNGTQTKLSYVPEQDTDFIFCTIGEEQGFLGSSAVLLLYLIFILRIIFLSERQPTAFGRVYGYSVASIFLFHLFINVGMVLGLTPVIGIPLPFFSYGGSSLWGFSLLLFIFLRIDAARTTRYR